MCGIVGFVGHAQKNTLSSLLSSIPHRGPDDHGDYLATGIQMGFRRLSIIDLSPSGHQPMTNEDESIWIAFNGEIYNYQELRKELVKKHRFMSQSDTEVLIHGYEEWGIDKLLSKINGMFAFCLHDKNTQQTFLARDRIGKKPLYYFQTKDYLAFSSETKAFFKLKEFSFGINPDMFELFMGFPYLPDNTNTLLKGVLKIAPGHYMRISEDLQSENIAYWRVPKSAQLHSLSYNIEKLEFLLSDAINKRLIADVPVGILLSGGLDSSLITAVASKNNKSINTITISFPKSGIDESMHAAEVSRHCNTTHHDLKLSTPASYDVLEKNIDMYDDLSTTDSGLFSTYLLSREIRKLGVRVVLVGEGADELFGGYSWFGFSQKPFSYLPESARTTLYYYAIMRQLPGKNTRKHASFLHQKLQETGGSYFKKIQAYEARYSLPNHYCMKVDKGTMYASIEARAPYMDYRIVELVRTIKDQQLLSGDWHQPAAVGEKHILRQIAQKYLPTSIVERKKRGGMISVHHLLQEGLKKDKKLILSNPLLLDYYGREYLKNLIESTPTFKPLVWQREWILWKSLLFSLWYNHYA